MTFIRFVYTLFVGSLIAVLIGVSISAFYKAPEMPVETPYAMTKPAVDGQGMVEDQEKIMENQKRWEQYNKDTQRYNANVAIISLGMSVIVMVLGIWVLSNNPVLSDSMAIGGMFGLIYSITRGFSTKDEMLRLAVTAVSLLVTVIVGQKKLPLLMKASKTGKKK